MICVYCEKTIRLIASTGRVRYVEGDADGIKEIHHVKLPNRQIPAYVTTDDGDVCPDCLRESKKEKKAKRQKGEQELPLVAEMRVRRDKLKAEKEKGKQKEPKEEEVQ